MYSEANGGIATWWLLEIRDAWKSKVLRNMENAGHSEGDHMTFIRSRSTALNKSQKNHSIHAIIEIIKKWLTNDDKQNVIMNDKSGIWTDYEVACVPKEKKKEEKEKKDFLERQCVEGDSRPEGPFSAIIHSTEGKIFFDAWFATCKRFLFFDVFKNWLKRGAGLSTYKESKNSVPIDIRKSKIVMRTTFSSIHHEISHERWVRTSEHLNIVNHQDAIQPPSFYRQGPLAEGLTTA